VLDCPLVTADATASPDEAREVAAAVRRFLEWLHGPAAVGDPQTPVARLLRDHLGEAVDSTSVVSRGFPPFDHVNLQVAVDAWSAQAGRSVVVQGLARPPHYGPLDLAGLLHSGAPARLTAPELVDLPVGPDRTLACLVLALLLVQDDRGRYVVLFRGPQQHEEPRVVLELLGLPTATAQEVLRDLGALALEHNVYRGQVLELVAGPGGMSVRFPDLPATSRDDVVLPEDVLRRVERHALAVAGHREALRAAGQHLKRGLLLHGPPGTGKTHTVRYLVQHLRGTTVLLLSGGSLHAVGPVTALARDLQPSAVVLEDVDLVAEDRGFGPGASPVLFELLDAMDGAAADADLLFLLTTNRADLLEPALAARPGRVDVAVEIGLPDAGARRRLLDLYARGVDVDWGDEDRAAAVDRTEGVTASFVKELLRRAVLEALEDSGGTSARVGGEHLRRALDDLLDSTQSVTRALLGVPADQSAPPASRGAGGHGGVWMGGAYESALEVRWDG
jgi:hypothetical protein